MDKVKKDLAAIERKLTKANKIVAKGSSMKLSDAIKLGSKGNSITSTLNKGVKEYKNLADPSDADAAALTAQMRAIVSLTESQMDLMVEHKGQFEKLHVAGLVKKNILKSQDAGVALSEAMIAKAPEAQKAEAAELEKRRVAAFKKAVDAFANSTGGEDTAIGDDDSD